MSEYTVVNLDDTILTKIKHNPFGEYKPDNFWKEMGKVYHNKFDKNASINDKASLILNMSNLCARIKEAVPIKVLEVGCGFGRCMPFVLEHCPTIKEIYGIEFSQPMIENSEIYLKSYPRKNDIHILQGKAQELPFESKSFDLVYTHVCLTHIPPKDIPQVVKEISRVAKLWILHFERFNFLYEHPNPHRWSHLLPPFYLDLGWEIVEYDVIHKEHQTKSLLLKAGEVM